MPSRNVRAPPAPAIESMIVVAKGRPRQSWPWTSSAIIAPCQLAIALLRQPSLQASIRPISRPTLLPTAHDTLVVDLHTPPGQSQATTLPGSGTTVTARPTAEGLQGMSQQREMQTYPSSTATSEASVQLMIAGACFAVPLKSKVSVSPRFVMASRIG